MSFDNDYIHEEFQNPTSLLKKSESKITPRYKYIGIVIDNEDPLDLGRVLVKVPKLDVKPQWAYPILPKHLHIIPHVDEAVVVDIPNYDNPNNERYYFPSIISSLTNIKKDSWFKRIGNVIPSQIVPETTSTKVNPDMIDVFPRKEDIAIIGRNNTDIIQRDEQIILRCGKHLSNDVFVANKNNPASITLIYDNQKSHVVNEGDKIYLLTHQGSKVVPKYISKENVSTLEDNTRPTLYGDLVLELLNLIIDAFLIHVHPVDGKPPLKYGLVEKLLNFKRDIILNKNVRVN